MACPHNSQNSLFDSQEFVDFTFALTPLLLRFIYKSAHSNSSMSLFIISPTSIATHSWLPWASGIETIIVRLSLSLAFCCVAPVIGIIALDLSLYIVRLFMWNSTETYAAIKRHISTPNLLHDLDTVGARATALGQGARATFLVGKDEDDSDSDEDKAQQGMLYEDMMVECDSDNLDEDDQIILQPRIIKPRKSRTTSITKKSSSAAFGSSSSLSSMSGSWGMNSKKHSTSSTQLAALRRPHHRSGVSTCVDSRLTGVKSLGLDASTLKMLVS